MDFNAHLQQYIEIASNKEAARVLGGFADILCDKMNKPEYQSWGRYLTIKQAMIYAGYKSKNGLYGFLKSNKIKTIKHSEKDVKIDRQDIDNAMKNQTIIEYKKALKI